MMNDHQIRQEKIEAYVMGQMSIEEQNAFQQEIDRDRMLAEEVRLHMMMKESLGNKEQNAFRKLVREVIEEERPVTSQISSDENRRNGRSVSISRWKWLAAAVVIALVGFFSWFLIGLKPAPSQLFAQYFEAYPAYQVNRSEENLPQLQKAMEYYGLEKYHEAAEILDGLETEDQGVSDMINFYHGITQMEAGLFQEAEELFLPISENPGSQYQQQSRWYLALTFLKQKQREKAKELLTSLSGEPGRFGKQAKALLEEL
jgi:hypothetical protein